MKKLTLWLVVILLFLVLVAVILGISAAIFYWLWNWLIPTIFSGPVITFWQAVGLCLLLSMIGGFVFNSHKK